MTERRYELDWLRVLAVLLLIYFHSARVFDMADFYVKNSILSEALGVFVSFVSVWFMPLFFFIAGAAASFAMKHRTAKEFISERAKRLLIPLAFGWLVIVPPQIFAVFLQKPGNPASYIAFWKFQFSVAPLTRITAGSVGDEALRTALTWEPAHLWFILYLFLFCLVSLPLFSSIRDGKLNKQVTGFAEFCQGRSWGIYLFAVPIMILNTLGSFLDQNISRMFLIVAFIFGFIVYSNPGFGEAIDAQRRKVLTITIVTTIALVLIILIGDFEMEGLEMLVFGPLLGIETWLWILTFLSAARNKLNYKNRFLAYANEGSYPFYILHQTIIVLLALGITKMGILVILKYLMLTTISLLLTLCIYDLLVRRWAPMRFLFGMPRKTKVS